MRREGSRVVTVLTLISLLAVGFLIGGATRLGLVWWGSHPVYASRVGGLVALGASIVFVVGYALWRVAGAPRP